MRRSLALGAAVLLLTSMQSGCAPQTAMPATSQPTSLEPAASEDEDRDISTTVARLNIRISARANLAYQLDCMARMIPCSASAFESLWQQSLGWSAEDEERLSTWRTVRSRYGGRIEIRGEEKETRLPLPRAELYVQNRIYLASAVASSDGEYSKLLEAFMLPGDVATLQSIEAHFRSRFSRWWQEVDPGLNRFADEIQDLVRDSRTQRLLEGARRFYGAGNLELTITMIARPSHDSPSYGRQLGAHSFVEVGMEDSVARRLPTIVHELMHSLHALGDRERLAALADWFSESDDPLAVPAYHLLNEALATALANGLFGKVLGVWDETRRLYHDEDVHRAALATIPLVETTLATGASLYDDPDFATAYLSAIRAAFPNGFPVVNYLRPLVCIHGESFPNLREHVDRATQASSRGGLAANDSIATRDSIELLRRFPRWPRLFVVSRGDIQQLAELESELGTHVVSEVKRLAREHSAFVFSGHRAKGKGLVSILVAEDESAALRLFDEWISQPTLPATFHE